MVALEITLVQLIGFLISFLSHLIKICAPWKCPTFFDTNFLQNLMIVWHNKYTTEWFVKQLSWNEVNVTQTQIATSSSYFNNTKRACCCVCAQGKAQFPRNPLPVLWIKCHLAAHKVTSVRKQRVIKRNLTHNALPGIRLCRTADKSGCTFHRVRGAAPPLQQKMPTNQQVKEMYWPTMKCIVFFSRLPSCFHLSEVHSGLS